jgi:hypothetical protein
MSTITIDLEAAGLTHAKGKSDKCNGEHGIDMLSVLLTDDSGLVRPDDLAPLLQALHEQAHPEGAAYWQNCRERGCAEMRELPALTVGES